MVSRKRDWSTLPNLVAIQHVKMLKSVYSEQVNLALLTPTWKKAKFKSTNNMQMKVEKLPDNHHTVLDDNHQAFPEWDQSLPYVSTIPPYKLRGVTDTCRGACCSQGPRQRAAGERQSSRRLHMGQGLRSAAEGHRQAFPKTPIGWI